LSTANDHEAPLITYAQNLEDVRIWKALAQSEVRNYVDIGAGDPTRLSVTRLFYERGWRGINVEPGPSFSALVRERPYDINLQVAVANEDGIAKFNVAYPSWDLSSLDSAALAADPTHIDKIDVVDVQIRRLTTILDEHLNDGRVAFLKVDTEGTEFDVLSSNDWKRFRPFIVVVEAISPGSHTPTHEKWERILLDANYEFAVFDGINRFYVAESNPDLTEKLREPVSALDLFVPYPLVEAWSQRQNDQATLAQYMARIRQIDGDLKVAEVELRRVTAELRQANEETQHRVDEIRELNAARDELEHVVAEMRDAWSWRLGQRVVRVAGPMKPYLKTITEGVDNRRRNQQQKVESFSNLEPSELANVRAAYSAATARGAPLETVMTMDRPNAYRPGGERFATDRVDALWRDLAARRLDSPRLLDTDEIALLEIFLANANEDVAVSDLVNQILSLRKSPDNLPVPGTATTLVIDVRPLQNPIMCGIKSHAANVLRSVLTHVSGRARMLFLTTTDWPPLDPVFAELCDGEWVEAGRLETVGAFLQLAPFTMAADTSTLDLLRAPWIKRAIVWFDAIVGLYPYAYLRNAAAFLDYQVGLEQLRHHDRILALSQTASREATALLGDRDQVSVTGCLSSVKSTRSGARLAGLPFSNYVLALGNALPHKNLAAAVAGFVPGAVRASSRDLGLVVVANIPDDQSNALRKLAGGLGLEPHRLVHLSQVSSDVLAQLYSFAEATVLPSFHEGFSLPVIESVGAGTPVVLSDIPAHREMLCSDRWFFPAEDPAALSTALQTVLNDPAACLTEQRSQLGRRFDGHVLDKTVADAVDFLVSDLTTSLSGATMISDPVESAERPSRRSLSLSKICELEDFSDPRLESVIRDVFPHEFARFGADFPRRHEWRKYWEVGMAILTFMECGLLDGSRSFLGIGAGNEPTIFYLTRFARQVMATDLYLGDEWDESAHSSMLTNPERHWPFAWNPRRLTVAHMNALDLRVETESVDAIFSSSSVEHFGQRSDVARSLDEAFRVLKPGGVLSVSTEFRLRGERPGIPGVLMFDQDDIETVFLGSRDWGLIEPFDPTVSAATMATEADFKKVVADQEIQVARFGGHWTHHLEFEYPHIVLSLPKRTFTSFHLALRKA
jgi:FkbM family methyltransferase